MWKTERWHWDKEQKKTFSTLKKSLSRTAHLVIFQAACEKVFETDVSDFEVETCLY